jgi:hypothetical protein
MVFLSVTALAVLVSAVRLTETWSSVLSSMCVAVFSLALPLVYQQFLGVELTI